MIYYRRKTSFTFNSIVNKILIIRVILGWALQNTSKTLSRPLMTTKLTEKEKEEEDPYHEKKKTL